MNKSDFIQRFYFKGHPVRGAIVKLSNSFVEALNGRAYPLEVQTLLGECTAATVLMGVNLKQVSSISLQASGQGPLSLLMSETTLHVENDADDKLSYRIRSMARNSSLEHAKPSSGWSLTSLLGKAHLAITIEPKRDALSKRKLERYQGIVPLERSSLQHCLKDYFLQSEQLPTLFQLAATEDGAAGLLLQRMPDEQNQEFDGHDHRAIDDLWQELDVLTSTLSHQELLTLPCETILHRLFNEYDLILTDNNEVNFHCSCSQQRTAQALITVDPLELEDILQEQGEVVMDCEFCSTRFRFTRADINHLQSQGSTQH